jgi:flagellar biosynthesis GTPase FlhF
MPIDGLVITKVDETISLGSVYTLTCETGLPICYLTNGQRIPEDLEAATPEKVVDLMVGAVPDQLRSTTLNVKDRRYEGVDLFLEEVL